VALQFESIAVSRHRRLVEPYEAQMGTSKNLSQILA
jgi:hypothetical protein